MGWDNAWPYLVLPVLLILSQYASTAVLSPIDPNQENVNQQRALFYLLPLLFSWIGLTVPSGLTLYYVANSIFTTLAQVRNICSSTTAACSDCGLSFAQQTGCCQHSGATCVGSCLPATCMCPTCWHGPYLMQLLLMALRILAMHI